MLHHIVKLITMSTKNAEEEEDRNYPVPLFIEATTTTSALEKLSKINFKSAEFTNQKIILIKIKIDDQIDEKFNETSFAHYFNASSAVLLTIKSEKLAKIFWKTAKSEKFYLLQICDIFGDIELDFCEQFLISEIIDDKNGILSKSQERRNLNLQDIGNENEQNLLMLASIDNRDDVVAELLKHDFDVDDEDSEEHNAIEKAWMNCTNASNLEIKEKSCKIILSLLKNNSKYPKKFDFKMKNELEVKSYEFSYENCSESVKNFVDYSEKLHILVTESNLEELKLEIVKEPWLCYFYDRNNKSLIAHAIEFKDIDIWKFLISLRLSIGQHEIQNLGEFYESYDSDTDDLKDIQLEHTKCARELSSSHVHFLLTCSRIGSNDRRSDERWNLVEEAFRIMDTYKSCSKILKIATKWKRLTIYFDFKHDTAYYLDPVSSLGTKGVIYGVHMIYIGAKYLPDVKMKHVVISTIIHELCHLAVFLTYINNYDPYPKGESDDKRRFEDEVVPECEENGDFEDIVGTVAYYIQEHHNSEYIVRVVQMLMHYYVLDPTIECENSKILKDRREKFGKLFKYFEEVVERDFNDFLGIIDTLLDESVDIKYDQLTGPMKARILHSKVNFQGQETTLHEIIGNKEEILSKMTSKQIRDMLIKGDCIEIGSQHKTTTKFSSVERQFKIPSSYKCKTMSDIQSEVEDTKIFILSDSAGAGKTTTFEELTGNLKETNKNSWVSFVKLRTYRSIFDSYNKSKDLCLEDVLALLIDIKDLKDKLEVDIFKFLFANDGVILLLDGVDEISPDYNDFMIKIMKILKEKTINQLWISSRPQCANMLEDRLNVRAHKLEPYTTEERDTFINEIYDSYKECSKDKSKADTMNDLKVFFELLKNDQYNNEVNNPLMIKMITELYIQGQIDLNTESANLFDIFDKVTEQLREEIADKVINKDNNAFKDFNLGHVHQLLALKNLFEYKDIKDLSIMDDWKEKRLNWSVDQIQRFGYVTLDSRFDKDPRRNYIDYIHRTYADFFAAQFIISIFFDSKFKQLKENKNFAIIFGLISKISIFGDSSIAKFLISYMQSNKNKKIQGNENVEWICMLFRSCIKQQESISEDRRFDEFEFSQMKFILILLRNNPKIIESIWKLEESQNFLDYTLLNTRVGIREISELLYISFGLNWVEKFRKNNENFKFENSNEIVKLNVKNELKLIEFVENNFDISKRCKIYENHFIFSTLFDMSESMRKNVTVEMFMRFVEITSNAEENAFFKIVQKLITEYDSIEVLLIWKEKCENLLINCEEKFKKFLYQYKSFIINMILNGQLLNSNDDRFKRLKSIKNVWINNEYLKDKLRKKLSTERISFENLLNVNFENIHDILLELYKDCPLRVLEIFHFNHSDKLFLNQENYDKFKKFLLSFKNPNLIAIFVKRIFISDRNCLSFIKILKDGQESFKLLKDLLLFDQQSFKDLQDFFLWQDVFRPRPKNNISEMLLNMTDECYLDFIELICKLFENKEKILRESLFKIKIYKPIESQKTFLIFLKFLNDIFDRNDSIIVVYVRNSLIYYFSQSTLNFNTFTNGTSVARTLEIFKIYGDYSNDAYEELCPYLRSKNIFLEMISQLSEESCEEFIKICTKMFSICKPHPDQFFECNFESTLIFFKNKEKMANLEKFLSNIFVDIETRKYVKRNLIYDNFVNLIRHVVKDVETFDTFIKFIIDNNCSYDKFREIFVPYESLFQIYKLTTEENQEKLSNLMRNIFASSIVSIEASVTSYSDKLDSLNCKENCQYFQTFLISIIGHNNQDIVNKCMIRIFRCIYDNTRMAYEQNPNYYKCNCWKILNMQKQELINEAFDLFLCPSHELILSMFYYDDFKEIEILSHLTKNYKDHWEWAQNLFLDKFPFEAIQRMPSEVFEEFERFLKLVFKSNKIKLSEKIQNKYLNDEIMNNDNENCLKFVKTFIKFDENN